VEPEKYWDQMPTKRSESFRHLPMEAAGCANEVNEATILRAHDRTVPLRSVQQLR